MRITGKHEITGVKDAASDTAHGKPRTRFSEVLEEDQQRTNEDTPAEDGEKKETVKPKKRSEGEPIWTTDAMAVLPALGPPPPFSSSCDVAPADGGHGIVAGQEILTSLVKEIAVEASPDGPAFVDIQFDSRTLEGLHVRVQKAGDSVEVRFSTSSEAVSRLLTSNVDRLAEALIQRGYVAPTVSVLRAQGSTAFAASDSGRSGRDGDNHGRQDQGRGQKRR